METEEAYKKHQLKKIQDLVKALGITDVTELPSQMFCKEFTNLLIVALKSKDEKDIIAFLSHPINCSHFECSLLKVVDSDLSKLCNTPSITSESFGKLLDQKIEQNTKMDMEDGK